MVVKRSPDPTVSDKYGLLSLDTLRQESPQTQMSRLNVVDQYGGK